ALIRVGRRRGRTQAERRAAARAMPVVPGAGPEGRPARPSRRSDPAGPERAGSWDDLPAPLSSDRPWAVAVVLLGAPAVRERTAPFVDGVHRSVDWPALLEESRSWPPDQRALVQGAYELSGASGGPARARGRDNHALVGSVGGHPDLRQQSDPAPAVRDLGADRGDRAGVLALAGGPRSDPRDPVDR